MEAKDHPEAMVNPAALDPTEHLAQADHPAGMANLVELERQETMAQLAAKDPTVPLVTLDLPDPQAHQAAKATMVNLAAADHPDPEDQNPTTDLTVDPEKMEPLAPLDHLAKMLNTARARHAGRNEHKWTNPDRSMANEFDPDFPNFLLLAFTLPNFSKFGQQQYNCN